MVGLIWFVQVVHYPLFTFVGDSRFLTYEGHHTRRTGWVVGVLMPLEAVTALWLVLAVPTGASSSLLLAGLALLGALWLTTVAIQVPIHRSLSQRRDNSQLRRLVVSNWIRTALWTLRGVVVLLVTYQLLV